MNNLTKLALLAAVSTLLTACGGSSGGSGSGSSSQPASSSSSAHTSSSAPSSSAQSSAASSAPLVNDVSAYLRTIPTPTAHDVIPAGERTFFVSTVGADSNPGTQELPFATLNRALNGIQAGDVIVMREGVYLFNDTVRINTSGTANNNIKLFAYPGEEPILDFEPQGISNNSHGLRLNGSYWHVYGLTVRNAGHNGIRVDGSHNRLERLVAHNNYDTGILLSGSASHNLVMNCDSFHNFNLGVINGGYTERVGNNADGFGVKQSQIGPGNYLYGNRSWENSDDGYDFWMAPNTIVLENNWAFGNGDANVFGSPTGFEGGGNGFKLGGNGVAGDHIVIGNLAFDNFGSTNNAKGFDHNNNSGAFFIVHNTAFNNGRNYDFPNAPQDTSKQHIFYNNLSIDGSANIPLTRTIAQNNSWQFPVTISTEWVASIDTSLAKAARQEDGSLPEIPLLRVPSDSPLNGAGVNIGISNGAAPELGAYGYIPKQD